jgi:hypothetical protein
VPTNRQLMALVAYLIKLFSIFPCSCMDGVIIVQLLKFLFSSQYIHPIIGLLQSTSHLTRPASSNNWLTLVSVMQEVDCREKSKVCIPGVFTCSSRTHSLTHSLTLAHSSYHHDLGIYMPAIYIHRTSRTLRFTHSLIHSQNHLLIFAYGILVLYRYDAVTKVRHVKIFMFQKK